MGHNQGMETSEPTTQPRTPGRIAPCAHVAVDGKEMRIYGSAGLIAVVLPVITDAIILGPEEARELAWSLTRMARRAETADPGELIEIE